MNNACIIGNLTKDPEFKEFTEGKMVCNFIVAVNRHGSNQKKDVDFIPVESWGGIALNCSKFLKKGRKVGVMGRICSDSYDVDGDKRHKTYILANDVEFLTPKER